MWGSKSLVERERESALVYNKQVVIERFGRGVTKGIRILNEELQKE